jgi:hypothetical protein
VFTRFGNEAVIDAGAPRPDDDDTDDDDAEHHEKDFSDAHEGRDNARDEWCAIHKEHAARGVDLARNEPRSARNEFQDLGFRVA